MAPGAEWVGCVNLDRNLGNPARYLDCLQFMLAPFPAGGDPFTDGRPERAPHVLTNSWGCPPIEGCDPAALSPAATALTTAGIFVVAAAGNSGPRCGSIEDPPAPYADVFTVGAVDDTRTVADFSSRGPAVGGAAKPDVVAPGAGVLLRDARRRLRHHGRHLDGDPAGRRGGRADVVGAPGADRGRGDHDPGSCRDRPRPLSPAPTPVATRAT